MAIPTFDFTPSYRIRFRERPQVNTTKLGEGFEFRTPHGLRPRIRTWRLRFENIDEEEVQRMIDFFRDRNGYRQFKWTPLPPDNIPGIWIATDWSVGFQQGPLYSVDVTFQEQ